jgi:hypothetical protein
LSLLLTHVVGAKNLRGERSAGSAAAEEPGMQWSLETSDGLAALRTLIRSGGWERYWVAGEVLPLAEAA